MNVIQALQLRATLVESLAGAAIEGNMKAEMTLDRLKRDDMDIQEEIELIFQDHPYLRWD